ncbi:MAG: hypothetical protein LBC86_05220 [Oscillospiraceae bacterium]|jgi:hypothetical protein|nr:hypothetical protein [Oscillospiraceae bacterium]
MGSRKKSEKKCKCCEESKQGSAKFHKHTEWNVTDLIVIFLLAAKLITNLFGLSGSNGNISEELIDVLTQGSGITRYSEDEPFTLLIYMNGSNLESRYSLATANINEMLSELPQNDYFNVVLLTGGTRTWHSQGLSAEQITYSHITASGFEIAKELPNQSIGEAHTLSEFISYGLNEFPAPNNALIFWNHGGGSVLGFGYDELFDYDTLTLREIRDGLHNGLNGHRFNFIGFDACLMATVETAYACAPYADYLVASQELEPGGGWAYDKIFRIINESRDFYALDLCKSIVDSYITASTGTNSFDQLTLSVINLNKIGEVVSALGELAAVMYEDLEFNYAEISKVRNNTKSFGRANLHNVGTDMVDIIHFAENLRSLYPVQSRDVISAVRNAVVYSRSSDNVSDANGLAVYFPYANKRIAGSLTDYMNAPFNSNYLNMTRAFANRLLGGTYKPPELPVQGNELNLDANTMYNIVDIYSVLIKKDGDMLVSLGYDSDIDFNTGRINMDFSGDWVSINNTIVSIYPVKHTEDVILYSSPALLNDEFVELMICYDDENPTGIVFGARRISDQPDKGYIPIETDDEIAFLRAVFNLDSTERDYIEAARIVVYSELEVDVVSVSTGEYLFGFCLIDIYQNKHYTEFIEITTNCYSQLS